MMEDDDLYSDEEGDFVPLISSDSSSPEIKRKHSFMLTRPTTSFEIVSASIDEMDPSTKNKCLAVAAISIACVGIILGCSLVRLGLSRMSDGVESSLLPDHSLNDKFPTMACHPRFNRTYQDVFLQITDHQESLCSDRKTPRCNCQNPLVPMARTTSSGTSINQQWNQAFAHNQAIANRPLEHPYDVVFFGDSITQNWNNPGSGIHGNNVNTSIHDVFRKHFRKESGGRVDGFALGIPGDRCSHLFYRLRNGELPDMLQAKVFWVLIGTNDLGDLCSVEAVVVGIIQIALEIVNRRPDSIVVLNSILPRGYPGSDIATSDVGWPQIAQVNRWLECYANENERVEFFNATDIFLQPGTTKTVAEYYQDPVHPSPMGHARWASAIVDMVLDLMIT